MLSGFPLIFTRSLVCSPTVKNLDSSVLINAFTLGSHVPSPFFRSTLRFLRTDCCDLSRRWAASLAPVRCRWVLRHYGRFAHRQYSKSKQQAPRRSHYEAHFHAALLIDACVISPQQEGFCALSLTIATIQSNQLVAAEGWERNWN